MRQEKVTALTILALGANYVETAVLSAMMARLVASASLAGPVFDPLETPTAIARPASANIFSFAPIAGVCA